MAAARSALSSLSSNAFNAAPPPSTLSFSCAPVAPAARAPPTPPLAPPSAPASALSSPAAEWAEVGDSVSVIGGASATGGDGSEDAARADAEADWVLRIASCEPAAQDALLADLIRAVESGALRIEAHDGVRVDACRGWRCARRG